MLCTEASKTGGTSWFGGRSDTKFNFGLRDFRWLLKIPKENYLTNNGLYEFAA